WDGLIFPNCLLGELDEHQEEPSLDIPRLATNALVVDSVMNVPRIVAKREVGGENNWVRCSLVEQRLAKRGLAGAFPTDDERGSLAPNVLPRGRGHKELWSEICLGVDRAKALKTIKN